MISTWQDFDENIRTSHDYGKWWASRSVDGHIQHISGPHTTEQEASEAVGGQAKDVVVDGRPCTSV